ncbi:peptide chain release factor 1-like, mitochondrial isoform X2 [Sphaerodactylus townsendi]|uniref:peptide chain release factor 1-like, mitochondrial isoform X2 n=1 Tax=Sphaerodactylus townsendi TaxID=933632 RepID=UPI002026E8E3|nr:peptide chain release factor 1-like, mitochondrial isoform X2 [Sphaerodactylus townsendi]
MWRCLVWSPLWQRRRPARGPAWLSMVLARSLGWPEPRRSLTNRPNLHELFAMPALQRFLEQQMQQQQSEYSGGPRSQLTALIRLLSAKEQDLRDTENLAREDKNEDLRMLAEEEVVSCHKEIVELKRQIVLLLIPSEKTDESDLILEATAGVGGQEAMLFTAEMFDMYQHYAAYKNWNFEILEYMSSDIGGLEAYKHMKFEGGVHRVQRVPKTEKQGRIHTSTMTVAVLPQPTEINLAISPKDLLIETKRASGAGGQHVNTTDSAVRIVHVPTGVAAECQQERSQIRNKEKAMQVLRARLYNIKLEEESRKRESARKVQIGTRGRSEKIRTYNFPQDRVTDHRITRSVYHIEKFLLGEELLDEMIQSLREYAEYETLMEVISKSDPTRLS